MNLVTQLGLSQENAAPINEDAALFDYVNLKLSAMGASINETSQGSSFHGMGSSLLASYREKTRLLADYLPPCDGRIQDFINRYFAEAEDTPLPRLPNNTFVLDRHGIARMVSLPASGDHFSSSIIDSYRIAQGVLHNPKSDRRTTKGVFHVAEGGLPIPDDKKAVPVTAAARLLNLALNPPAELMRLPFTASNENPVETWVSLLMRPVVIPRVPGYNEEKTYEVRFFVPGNLVSNLDFVESIFGNGGDPVLPENDAALDPEHWTGTSGCVILAPHLVGVKKKALGLPNVKDATERQKRDGMCWEDPEEIYNDGGAFKITCRDTSGVVVTAIADNYFGYCKKEVKTQIGYSANLCGLAEEEHAGGTLAFTGADLGEDFQHSRFHKPVDHKFEDVAAKYPNQISIQPEGYGIDRNYPDIIYLPEDARISLNDQRISWTQKNAEKAIKLLPSRTYVYPSGYKVEMRKPAEGRRWRLAGYTAEGIMLHKPCTVSGGGKSEISKPISDAIISGPVFVNDFKADFDFAEKIIYKSYGDRFKEGHRGKKDGRPLLSKDRSLGSVVKLLTPSQIEFNDEYNAWLETIPQHVKDLVLIIKRFYKPDWGDAWRNRFSVDTINGVPGNELRYRGQKMLTQYLRVGYTEDGSWRTFGLRKDYMPSVKFSTEDDISASLVVPVDQVKGLPGHIFAPSAKFIHNCEYRFFQRPDDAIIRGYDKQTEIDMSNRGNFLSNYQPLTREDALDEIDDAIRFGQYTEPMRKLIADFANAKEPAFYCTNANPRIVDGKPTKNPRYLQVRPDLNDPRGLYLAEVSSRMLRRIPEGDPVLRPVTAILPGRRNNPAQPEAGVGALCMYNPIHYLELPELFMEYIASITGKSPSTTGAGSEGALTKGPFNALPPIYDLNNALVAYICTQHPVFITSAGYVGPNYRVDHDISLLVPEIWARMRPEEVDPSFLIKDGFLEKVEDFDHGGETIRASRLGYRITSRFIRIFGGRVFNNPTSVFNNEMLKPELQSMETYVAGLKTLLAAHKEAAEHYFADGSIELACPPIKALLHIMVHGHYEGKDSSNPEIRGLFDREKMLKSDWYKARLAAQQKADAASLKRGLANLEAFLEKHTHKDVAERLDIKGRAQRLSKALELIESPEYLKKLNNTIGRQPI